MYQKSRNLSKPCSGASSTSSYRNPKRTRCRDSSSRNMLSSSSSSSNENIFGISQETSSGIKLCEIDSLENFLSTPYVPQTPDINARVDDFSENLFHTTLSPRKSTRNVPTLQPSRSSSVSESKHSTTHVRLQSFWQKTPQETFTSGGGLSDIVQPEFPIISPTDSQTAFHSGHADTSESQTRAAKTSHSYTILPKMSADAVKLSKVSSGQLLDSVRREKSSTCEANLQSEKKEEVLPNIPALPPKLEISMTHKMVPPPVVPGVSVLEEAVPIEAIKDVTPKPSRQSNIPIKPSLKPRLSEESPSGVLGTKPVEPVKVPEISVSRNKDGATLATAGATNSYRANARNPYVQILEPVSPEPFSDYDEEYDLKYCSNVNTKDFMSSAQFSEEGPFPQTLAPTTLPQKSSAGDATVTSTNYDENDISACCNNVTNVYDTCDGRRNIENIEECFHSTDFSDTEIWLDEAFRANREMMVTETLDEVPDTKPKLSNHHMRRLNTVNANSSEDTFLDAVENFEDQPTYQRISTSSIKTKKGSDQSLRRSNVNTSVKINQPERLVESCKRTFHKMFPIHINETSESTKPSVEDTVQDMQDVNCNVVPSLVPEKTEEKPESKKGSKESESSLKRKSSKVSTGPKQKEPGKGPTQHQQQKPICPGKDEVVDLVDDSNGLSLDATVNSRWGSSPEYVDSLFVEIKVDNVDCCGRLKSYRPDKVILAFPLHKDDVHCAMVIVQNAYLVDPKVQYVNTPSEVVYCLPSKLNGDGRRLVGTFKIRSALTIPISFKLSSVQFMELIPSEGIILPKQSIPIRMHYVFKPELKNLNRLKLEGVLLYAAPFVFNRGCDENNVKREDILEFWSKFPGPRFKFAQTRFVGLHILRSASNAPPASGLMSNAWSAMKSLNPVHYEPATKNLHDYPSEIFQDKNISPIGHMILRRRQALLIDVKEHAEQLNHTRSLLTLCALGFASGYTLYHICGDKFDSQRAELIRKAAELTWIGNISKWLQKMIGPEPIFT